MIVQLGRACKHIDVIAPVSVMRYKSITRYSRSRPCPCRTLRRSARSVAGIAERNDYVRPEFLDRAGVPGARGCFGGNGLPGRRLPEEVFLADLSGRVDPKLQDLLENPQFRGLLAEVGLADVRPAFGVMCEGDDCEERGSSARCAAGYRRGKLSWVCGALWWRDR
jgi:hypothetical protein